MIIHAYTDYTPVDPETVRRNRVAQSTWPKQPWVECPIKDADLPRLWKERNRAFVFVRDLFDTAIAKQNGQPDDVLCYTNADIMVRGDACVQISACLQQTDACYAFRRDFSHQIDTPIPDADYAKGSDYCGSDLYGMRVHWWQAHRNDMPDMILGMEFWDSCIRVLIDETNPGRQVLLRDIICHERHGGATHWEHPQNRYAWDGQHHCLQLGIEFMRRRGINPTKFGIPEWYIQWRKAAK